MKYFIDFEATQFSEEIISVGCIREDGESFYSLVAPSKGKITPFITNLTGITKQMIDEAMSPDKVFEMFYDWAFVPDDTPDFYCWGDSDSSFIQHTFKRTTSRKARMALGYVCGGLIDYHKKFCKSTKLTSCTLIKAYNILLEPEAKQTHNALDDAVMLFDIYKFASGKTLGELRDIMAPIAVQTQKNVSKERYISILNEQNEVVMTFMSLSEATNWYIKNKIKGKSGFHKERIQNRIKKACDTNGKYANMNWSYV